MNTYIEAVKALLIPSDAQTQAFAEFVTGAHSWYKHLPILPLSPIVFFLDPNAGRSMVHVSDDEVTFVDNTEDHPGIHYTWQTTESYRRRFGCWSYEAPFGKSLQYMSEDGVIDTGGSGLNVTDANSSCWMEVPAFLVEAGTAMVSSLMYMEGAAQHTQVAPDPYYRALDLVPPSGLPELGPDSPEVIAALHALRSLLATPTDSIISVGVEIDGESHAQPGHLERDDNSISDATDPDAFTVSEAWKLTNSRERHNALMVPHIAVIDRERARQIDGMQAAMRRFIAALDIGGWSNQGVAGKSIDYP